MSGGSIVGSRDGVSIDGVALRPTTPLQPIDTTKTPRQCFDLIDQAVNNINWKLRQRNFWDFSLTTTSTNRIAERTTRYNTAGPANFYWPAKSKFGGTITSALKLFKNGIDSRYKYVRENDIIRNQNPINYSNLRNTPLNVYRIYGGNGNRRDQMRLRWRSMNYARWISFINYEYQRTYGIHGISWNQNLRFDQQTREQTNFKPFTNGKCKGWNRRMLFWFQQDRSYHRNLFPNALGVDNLINRLTPAQISQDRTNNPYGNTLGDSSYEDRNIRYWIPDANGTNQNDRNVFGVTKLTDITYAYRATPRIQDQFFRNSIWNSPQDEGGFGISVNSGVRGYRNFRQLTGFGEQYDNRQEAIVYTAIAIYNTFESIFGDAVRGMQSIKPKLKPTSPDFNPAVDNPYTFLWTGQNVDIIYLAKNIVLCMAYSQGLVPGSTQRSFVVPGIRNENFAILNGRVSTTPLPPASAGGRIAIR